MASVETSVPRTDSPPPDRTNPPKQEPQVVTSQLASSMPIEMKSLSAPSQPEQQNTLMFGPSSAQQKSTEQYLTADAVTAADSNSRNSGPQITPNFLNFDPQASISTDTASAEAPQMATKLTRTETAPAIGPATDKPTLIVKETTDEPVLFITLLLASTGARHPYKLDGKYLKKRSVEVEGNNPVNMSLYKLKELILRDWRSEWDAKPSSPESIRLIFRGKMLNDKSRLADNGFINGSTPQIVHMAIKPQEIVDEEEANKAIGKDRDNNERSPGCRCVIQ